MFIVQATELFLQIDWNRFKEKNRFFGFCFYNLSYRQEMDLEQEHFPKKYPYLILCKTLAVKLKSKSK